MSKTPQINYRTYIRSIIAMTLMIVWSLVTMSGFLLWLAPDGPRSGRTLLLFDLTKRDWGELHLYFSLAALAVTAAHLAIDWKGLCGCIKYLASVHRRDDPEVEPSSSASRSAQRQ